MEPRHLHLVGAAGKVRTEMHDGREHLVIPVVALMEGVIHAVNAETPEYVSAATLIKAAASWNGRPVVVGHPVRDGKQVSANDPKVLASHGIGTIFNSRVEGKKLHCEAWIDPVKAEKVGTASLLEALRDQRIGEVSVGAYVVTDRVAGSYNGKSYKASWLDTTGDHLAFLPQGRGACSVEMGCGSHRAATMKVCGEALEVMKKEVRIACLLALEGQSLDERIQAVSLAVQRAYGSQDIVQPSSYAYAQAVFDDYVILRRGDELYRVSYTVVDGTVTFGESIEVKQAYIAAEQDEEEMLRAAYGKTISAATMKTVQSAHDASHDMHAHTVALGAECSGMKVLAGKQCDACDGTGQMKVDDKQQDCTSCDGTGVLKTAELKAACRCEEVDVNKTERIAALLKNEHNPVKDITDKTSDEVLAVLEAQAETNKQHAVELKAAQDKQAETEAALKAAQAAQIPAEELTELRALAAAKRAEDDNKKTVIVAQLKTAQSEYTEGELKTMDLKTLERLARVAKVEAPDYSGRGLPRVLGEAKQVYTPPDPYEAALKTLKVN